MEQTSNIIISVIFLAMSVWLFYGVSKTRNLIFKDKLWNTYRVLFAIAGALCLLTGFLYTSAWDLIRLVLMTLCVIGFLLLRDGISDTGIAIMGRLTPFDTIRSYDYGDYKDSFRIYAVTEDDPDTKVVLTLPKDQKDEVIAFLKQKMGKKYTRMRKG